MDAAGDGVATTTELEVFIRACELVDAALNEYPAMLTDPEDFSGDRLSRFTGSNDFLKGDIMAPELLFGIIEGEVIVIALFGPED
jgi:hypothetical protein